MWLQAKRTALAAPSRLVFAFSFVSSICARVSWSCKRRSSQMLCQASALRILQPKHHGSPPAGAGLGGL
jgi:hypothetical protein